MKIRYVFMGMMLLAASVQAQENDFWLLAETDQPLRSSLQLYGGTDGDNARYYGLSLSQAVEEAQVYFRAGSQKYEVETRDWSVGLGSNPQDDFSARVDYAWSGESGELETRDVKLETTTWVNNWQFMLGYLQGEVEMAYRLSQTGAVRTAVVDRSAWHYGLGYSGEVFYASAEQRVYDYDRNISAISTSRFMQAIIRPDALSQALSLADKQTQLLVGLQGERNGIEIALDRIVSAADFVESDYVNVLLTHSLSRRMTLGLEWNKPLDDGDTTLGGLVNWRW